MTVYWTTFTVVAVVIVAVSASLAILIQSIERDRLDHPKRPGQVILTAGVGTALSWVAALTATVVSGESPTGTALDALSALTALAYAGGPLTALLWRLETHLRGYTEGPGTAKAFGAGFALLALFAPLQAAVLMLPRQGISHDMLLACQVICLAVGAVLAVHVMSRWIRRSRRIKRTQSHRISRFALIDA